MFRKLIKLFAYTKAPKRTFAFFHPIKALKWGAAYLLVKKIYQGLRTT